MIRYSCPTCGKKLKAEVSQAGKPCLCPGCQTRSQIPAVSTSVFQAQDSLKGMADTAASSAVLPSGTVSSSIPQIPGYQILEKLGQGGMGVVYKARQLSLDRMVAVKMILSGPQADPDSVKRFALEARALAQLKHTGIVQVYDFGQLGANPYLILEFVEGRSLDWVLEKGQLSLPVIVDLVLKIAQAMEYVHEQGILHRDLKPQNILMGPDGWPRVSDFGLAKLRNANTLTRTGTFVGTPNIGHFPKHLSRQSRRLILNQAKPPLFGSLTN